MARSRLKTVWWFEPRWSYLPAFGRELRRLFTAASWTRIVLASSAVTAVIYVITEFWVRPAMPAFKFNWLNGFLTSIAVLVGYLVLMSLLYVGIPPIISVTTKGIVRQEGQHATHIRWSCIQAVHIVLRRDGRHFIRIETAKRSSRIGLSRKVSLLALQEHIGEKLVVHDRRNPRCGS